MKITSALYVSALICATFPGLAQPLPGEVDLSFDAGSVINAPVYGTAILPDGRALITGDFRMVNGEMINGLARLQTNGTTDLTFTNNLGGPTVYGRALAVQPDGKILVGGQFNYYGYFTAAGVVRFNSEGNVETLRSFSGSAVFAVALQKDGKILLGGTFASSPRNHLLRLNSDASTDATFLYGLSGANGTVSAIAVQNDNRILVGGVFTTVNGTTCNGLGRLLPDGTLDPSFSASVSGGINSIAVQSDGKILIAGNFTSVNGMGLNRVARLNPNGSLDSAFSAGRPGADGMVSVLTLQPDGKILLGGRFSSINGTTRKGMARLNSDGSLDNSFSPGAAGIGGTVYSLSLSGSQLLVGGAITAVNNAPVNNLARLAGTGALDPSFGNGSTFFAAPVSCIVPQNDGRILVNGVSGTGIGRLGTNGAPDTTFLAGLAGADGDVNSIALSGGKILVGGAFTSFNGIDSRGVTRLNQDGSVDSSYKKGIGGTSGSINSLAVQPDGRAIVGGSFDAIQGFSRTNIARLNTDGSLDSAFQNNLGGAAGGDVFALATQPDNKILLGGAFDTVNGVTRKGIARLNPDGSLDAAFQTNAAGVNGIVYAIALQPDLKILIGGNFSSINNTSATHLARLNADGTLDLTFNAGAITAGSLGIQAIAVQDDGRVLVGGEFTQIANLALNNLARLSATGAVESFMTTGADAPVYALAPLNATAMLVGGGFASINDAPRSYIGRVFYRPAPTPVIPLDVALNNSQLKWTNDTVAPWQGQALISHDNEASAQSGYITDSQSTSLQSSFVGPATLTFWWKVSSETNYDFLTFSSVDVPDATTNQVRISGETGWLKQTVALPEGLNLLTWTYSKDWSVSVGQDAGWVDEVTVTPGYTPPQVVANPVDRTNVAGTSFSFTASATGASPLSFQWLHNGVPIAGATNTIYTAFSVVPEQAGTYSLMVTSPYGTNISSGAQLVVIPLRAFGANDYGQTTISNFVIDAVAIAAGQEHSLLLRRDGSVYAWGNNDSGQCTVPADLGVALGIAGGGSHSLAIAADRTVRGWGNNAYGQATPLAGLANVTDVAAGFWHSLALRVDGTVVAWGDNTFGQCSAPSSATNVVAIAAGGNHNLALRADGTVVAWGQNTDANGVFVGQSTIPWGLNGVVSIAAGEYHSLAVRRDGTIAAWGDNSYGQLAVPTNLPPAIHVAAGGTHSLAIFVDGTAAGWGDNFYNQATLTAGLTNIVALAAGNSHSLELFGLRPPQQVSSASWAAANFWLVVPTFADRLYSLEYNQSLTDTNWAALPLVRGLGGEQSLTNTSATGPRRFYRVRQW